MKVVAIIPCRSKSVSIPHKNLSPVGGRPLMAWAIQSALKAQIFNDVIVSTDSREYAKIAREWGASVPFLRPAPLAEDVPTEDVIIHALTKLPNFNFVFTIQCTTPFTSPSTLIRCLDAMHEDVDSSMTVARAAPAEWLFKKEGNMLSHIDQKELKGEMGVRQKVIKAYRPTGGCYATKVPYLLEKNHIIGERCVGIEVDYWEALDIDEPSDLVIAQKVAEYGLVKA